MYGNGYGMNYMPYQQANGAMHDVLSQYKGPYQQQIPPQMPQQMAQMTPQSSAAPGNDMIWVQGEAGAKAYLVAPNNTVVLWDTESPTIYIKTADATGKPLNMRILDFKERGTAKAEEEHKCTCGGTYVVKDDFKELQEKYTKLEKIVNALVADKEAKDG